MLNRLISSEYITEGVLNRFASYDHNIDGTHKSWIDAGLFSNFGAAIDYCGPSGSTNCTLLISNTVNASSNKTIPSHITLVVLGQGLLNISSGITVTHKGAIIAAPQKWITGDGDFVLGIQNHTHEVWGEWWGIDHTGSEDATDSIQSAVDAVQNAGYGTVRLAPGDILINSDPGIVITISNIRFIGSGFDVTTLVCGASSATIISVDGTVSAKVYNTLFYGFTIDGTASNYGEIGIYFVKATNWQIDWVRIYRVGNAFADRGIMVQGARSNDGNNCTNWEITKNCTIQNCTSGWGIEVADNNTTGKISARVQSCDGGIYFNGADAVGAPTSMRVDYAIIESCGSGSNVTGILADGVDNLNITNAYFESNGTNQIQIISTGVTRSNAIYIGHNKYDASTTTKTIDMDDCSRVEIENMDNMHRIDMTSNSFLIWIKGYVSTINLGGCESYVKEDIQQVNGNGTPGGLRFAGTYDTIRSKPSKVFAKRITSDQTIPDSTETTLIYNDDSTGELVDNLGEYDTSTGKFMPILPGTYLFSIKMHVSGANLALNELVYARIYKDSTLYDQDYKLFPSGNNNFVIFNIPVIVSTADVVGAVEIMVKAFQVTGANVGLLSSGNSTLNVIKIQ